MDNPLRIGDVDVVFTEAFDDFLPDAERNAGAAVKHQVDSEAIEHRDDAEGKLPAEDAAGMGEALDGGGHKRRTCLSGGDGKCAGAARRSGEGSLERSGGAA